MINNGTTVNVTTELKPTIDETNQMTLKLQLKYMSTYIIHAEFGRHLNLMYVTVLTIVTAAELSFINPTLIPDDFGNRIKPCSDIFIRSATNHRMELQEMINFLSVLEMNWFHRTSESYQTYHQEYLLKLPLSTEISRPSTLRANGLQR